MSLLSNLKIGQKLSLIIVVMGLPIAVLVYLFIDARNEQIQKAQLEIAGVEFLEPVRSLFRRIPQHQLAAEELVNGDESAQERVARLQPEIDADIAALDEAQQRFGSRLQTAEETAAVREAWQGLKQDLRTLSPEETFQRHAELAAKVRELIRTAGARSGLALDSEAGTRFLADMVIEGLPEVSATAGLVETLGRSMLLRDADMDEAAELLGEAAPAPGADFRQTAGRLIGQVEDRIAELERDAEIAYAESPGLRGRVSDELNAGFGAIRNFLNLSAEAFNARRGRSPVGADEYTQASGEATAALQAVYGAGLENLRSLLQSRISTLNQEKYLQLSGAVFILALTIALVLFLNRTITDQIDEINRLFGRIGVGDLKARARVRSHDELGRMTQSLNTMLDDTLALVQSSEERDRIQESIEKLLEEIAGVAEGDLTQEAEVTAEITGAIADSFNYMIAELRTIIAQVQQTTLQVSAAANQIHGAAESLAAGSEQQSNRIRNTSGAVETMAQQIQRVSANAASAATVAQAALQNARDGAEAVTKTIHGMSAIRNQVQQTSKRIKRLGESSQEIGEIVQLIGDIADRTSILALNASIQAAMAGESGRGFAVVAEEVEGLAERATQSTKRISTLIESIQQDMNEAVAAMEDTTREVVGGSSLANEAGQKLGRIEDVSRELAELIQSISQASIQQANGSEKVASAMGDISSITQESAEGARQAAGSIRDLAALADELRNSVSRFKIPAQFKKSAA